MTPDHLWTNRGGWSDEQERELIRLWSDERLTGPQIAQLTGRTKRAVANKCLRLGLRRIKLPPTPEEQIARRERKRAGERRRAVGYRKAKGAVSRQPTLPKQEELPPMNDPVTMMALEHFHCRWPIGEPDGPRTLFCGATKTPRSSYCAYHAAKAEGDRPGRVLRSRQSAFLRSVGLEFA